MSAPSTTLPTSATSTRNGPAENRIHYTREEGIFGVSWRFRPQVTGYAEVGVGNGLAGSVTSRLQLGVQYVSEVRFWKGRASHFAAIDIRTFEETDWSSRLTVQAGYRIPVGERSSAHRVAFEWGTGRSVHGPVPVGQGNLVRSRLVLRLLAIPPGAACWLHPAESLKKISTPLPLRTSSAIFHQQFSAGVSASGSQRQYGREFARRSVRGSLPR